MTRRDLTALEHQPIPVTAEGSESSLTPAEAERLALIGELRPGFCELGHRKVKLAQYCGVVGLGERVLEILPKTQHGDESADKCRGVLLRLLRATDRFPQFQHLPAGQHLRRAPLLEIFIAAYFDAVVTLGRGGLLRQYEERDEDLDVVRGRIAIARQLTVHANRPDRVACSFDEVDDSKLDDAQLSRLTFNRHAERYRVAIDWARWILALLSPALRAGANEAPTLLFDMNKLFETAVASVVKRRVGRDAGLHVRSQESGISLATISSDLGSDAAFSLRPDLVIRRGKVPIAVADTKWKAIDMDRAGRLVPGQEDMYQLHAYAAAYQCKDLALIYPWNTRLAPSKETRYVLPDSAGGPATVHVLCVDVHDDALPLRRGTGGGQLGALFTI